MNNWIQGIITIILVCLFSVGFTLLWGGYFPTVKYNEYRDNITIDRVDLHMVIDLAFDEGYLLGLEHKQAQEDSVYKVHLRRKIMERWIQQ